MEMVLRLGLELVVPGPQTDAASAVDALPVVDDIPLIRDRLVGVGKQLIFVDDELVLTAHDHFGYEPLIGRHFVNVLVGEATQEPRCAALDTRQ